MFQKKNYYRPLYKQFLKLRENVQEKKKLLKFKRIKWKKFITQYKKKLRRYKKFRAYDQTRYLISKHPNKWTSYKKRFRNSLNAYRKLKVFYGGLSKKYIKKQIRSLFKNKIAKKNHKNWSLLFLEKFEKRLDSILYRSKFSPSLRNARQLIVHGKVFVNNKQTKTPSYIVKETDIISIDPKYYFLINQNLKNINIWNIPPRYLTINYNTLEIIVGNIQRSNTSINFPFYLNLEKVIVSYYRQ